MHNRSSTPDILGSLMSGSTMQPETHKPIRKEESKEKATFNLSTHLLHELEDTCHEMRKILKSKQISKTLLVEEALKMALQEFHTNKQASAIFQNMKNHIAIK